MWRSEPASPDLGESAPTPEHTMTSNRPHAPSFDSDFARAVAEFCLDGHTPPSPDLRAGFAESKIWSAVRGTGTHLWLDTGDVEAIGKIWTREFEALTTNNTLLNKEVQKGMYDDLVPKAASRLRELDGGLDESAQVLEIAFILNAVHALELVRTFDANVSVELHTDLAHDAEASYQYGKRYNAISPDRFIVKVPLTPQGLFAARRLVNDGIRVNFTLGFSARQNYLIANVARPNYVNVFLGRCNSFVADNDLGDGQNVGEKATLASQRAILQLREDPGLDVKQIAASMRGGDQVGTLLGVDVFTMPTKAAQQFLDAEPDPADLAPRLQDDPEVTFAGGIDPRAAGFDAFWSVGDEIKTAACKLAGMDLDRMSGAELLQVLADHGAGDLFPDLSEADREQIAEDGKIPVYSRWKDRVAAGKASWDGIMTASALGSFATDQKALDDRVRGLL